MLWFFAEDFDEFQSWQAWISLRLVMSVMTGFFLVGGLKFIATIEQDACSIRAGLQSPPDQPVAFSTMTTTLLYLAGLTAGAALGIIIDGGPARFIGNLFGESLIPSLCLLLIIAPVLVILHACIYRLGAWLLTISEETSIRFLDMEVTELVSRPLLRVLLLSIIGLSFGPAVMILTPDYQRLGQLFLLFAVAGLVTQLPPLLRPVLRLRERIIAARERELLCIQRYYRGDQNAIGDTGLAEVTVQPTLADIMAYENRVRTTWEIPVPQASRKLLLFGLLPPVTWALAALVENALF